MYNFQLLSHGEKQLTEVGTLLQSTFKNTALFTKAYLDWQYKQNPDGMALGFNAYTEEDELAAHYVTQPLRAVFFGKEVKGLLSLNTATHPKHSGKGLFTKLANATYESARAAGYDFVIGVANKNSTHGFVNKLGFRLLSPLHARIGFGYQSEDVSKQADYARIWSKESLEWRLKNPSAVYEIKKMKSTFFVCTDSGKPFIQAVLGNYEKHLMPDSHSTKGGHNGLLHLTLCAGMSRASSSFSVEIPKSMRPSPLHLIFKNLKNPDVIPDFNKVCFDALDFDAY